MRDWIQHTLASAKEYYENATNLDGSASATAEFIKPSRIKDVLWERKKMGKVYEVLEVALQNPYIKDVLPPDWKKLFQNIAALKNIRLSRDDWSESSFSLDEAMKTLQREGAGFFRNTGEALDWNDIETNGILGGGVRESIQQLDKCNKVYEEIIQGEEKAKFNKALSDPGVLEYLGVDYTTMNPCPYFLIC